MVADLPRRVVRKVLRTIGRPSVSPAAAPPDEAVRALIAQADAARDRGQFNVAAAYYAKALEAQPDLGPIHVQAGHMFKEAGNINEAERHYHEALARMPDDADLALQLGHFYKVAGQLDDARAQYRRALDLAPGWTFAEDALEDFSRNGWRGSRRSETGSESLLAQEDRETDLHADDLRTATLYGRMAPELLPRPMSDLLHYSEEAIVLRQFGVEQRTYWGYKPVVRGIEAIRGFILSEAPLADFRIQVNGLTIHRGCLKGPYELEYEPDKARIHKYVFNVWFDFENLIEGHYELRLAASGTEPADLVLTQWFVVEPALREGDHPDSDGVINLPPDGHGSLEQQIAARPSVVREAWRPNQLGEVRSILVARSDQLGDLVASIPAILRLREIFPAAQIIGVFSAANIGLARTLGVFDDLLVINHAESWHQRTRPLSLSQQVEFRDLCAPYRFDLAIDLSQSLMSRPMLQLTGARLTYGFKDPGWHRLVSSYEDHLFDAKNRRENAAHSKRVLNMIERLHTATHPVAEVIRRSDLSRALLKPYGLDETEAYAVLHAGARIQWSRWSKMFDLAERLLQDTNLKIVFFSADEAHAEEAPCHLLESDRFVFITRNLPFDILDAVLSFCSVYVGNDSGPKHLASLRGAPVVSIHSSRINWSEWGQEQTGVIISRKVPCAGCTIYHDPEDCGKDYACMNIGLEDVYAAVRRYV